MVDKPIDQTPGDADAGRDGGKFVVGEPSGLDDFRVIDCDFSTGVLRRKTDHHRVGEGQITYKIFLHILKE